jgi:hypothetical protein
VGWLKSLKNSHGGINEAGRAEFVEGKRLTTQGGEEGRGRPKAIGRKGHLCLLVFKRKNTLGKMRL